MKWAIVGEIATPYKITEKQLLGDIHMTPHEPTPLHLHPGFSVISDRFIFLDKFKISLIKFDPNAIHQRLFLYPNLPVIGVVAYHDDKVIGIAHDRYLVIDKNYRGMQLGSKLLAEQYLAMPGYLDYRREDKSKRYYTSSGLKTTKGAYHYMLEHGAIAGE